MAKRIELKIYGDVQGVSFRVQVHEIAKSLGLVGYVKNEPDGTVKIIAEGGEKGLKTFIKKCYTLANVIVEKINVEWKEGKGEFGKFVIKY